ncbi:MAG TPA: hypothetical protein VFG20_19915 [Planctomycetaceae bacterium]|nr:hypothetical protein [Planctomycetaceae bacterium]
MTISVDCDECGGTFKVQDKRAGKQVYCKLCNAVVRVPRTIVETRNSEPGRTESSDAALSETHEDEPDEVAAIAPLPRLTSSYESSPVRTRHSGRQHSSNGFWPLSGRATAGLVVAVVLGLMIIGSRFIPW